jgi:hypothetical protein
VEGRGFVLLKYFLGWIGPTSVERAVILGRISRGLAVSQMAVKHDKGDANDSFLVLRYTYSYMTPTYVSGSIAWAIDRTAQYLVPKIQRHQNPQSWLPG